MSTRGSLRLATRGSDLAVRQAASVRDALADRRYDVDLVEVETRGDQIRDELIHRLGKTGAFVRALDERVLDGDVDGAVHSMKDMPTESPPELQVVAVPERGPPGDVLLTPDGGDLDDLPAGATVGTASMRRQAQLLAHRDDLEVVPIRGNVDTRIEKLLAPGLQREHERRLEAEEDGDEADGEASDDADGDGADDGDDGYDRTAEEWFDDLGELERKALGREVDEEFDALVLAESGLQRAGLLHQVPHRRLPVEEFVPAPGQGALAITATAGEAGEVLHDVLDHPRTRAETTVERTVLAELNGGCIAPIGAYAVLQGAYVHVTVRVLSPDGTERVEGSRDLPVETHAEAAAEFAADLRERGAAELVEQAREEADGD